MVKARKLSKIETARIRQGAIKIDATALMKFIK